MLDITTPKLNNNIIAFRLNSHKPNKYKIKAVKYTKMFVITLWINTWCNFPIAIKYDSMIESITNMI